MAEFSAHHISSKGLKYALSPSAIGPEEFDKATYQTALLNVLNAQDFDSIPLVDCYKGPITSIGRRRLHDGDVEDVFILTPNEVSTMPWTSSVIQCIFEVLSNEHHIVFLTKDDEIQDVVTIGMLTNPLIKDYLTLLIGRLHSEGWNFNKDHLGSDTLFDYEYPVVIHEELIKLAQMIDHPEKLIPSDLEVSTQIVSILSLLQPLKKWKGSPESKAIDSIDYPLKIPTSEYESGTAGSFAQHPFGAINENQENETIENLAFKLFTEANDWDQLLVRNESGEFTHFIDKYQPKKTASKSKIEARVPETTEFEKLIHHFGPLWRPLCVQSHPYPGIISIQDLIYSKHAKFEIALTFVNFEKSIRNMYLHILNTKTNRNELKYLVGKNNPKFAWDCSIQRLFFISKPHLPPNMMIAGSTVQDAFDLRNSFLHNDFFIQPEGKIDHLRTYRYAKFMKKHRQKLRDFIHHSEKISKVPYAQFATVLEQEFKGHAAKTTLGRDDFRSSFVQLKFNDEKFHIYFDEETVVAHAKEIKTKLENRRFPWEFEVHLWQKQPSERSELLKKSEKLKQKAQSIMEGTEEEE